jgi:hypothetical protein
MIVRARIPSWRPTHLDRCRLAPLQVCVTDGRTPASSTAQVKNGTGWLAKSAYVMLDEVDAPWCRLS